MRQSYKSLLVLFLLIGISCVSSKSIEESNNCFCPSTEISFKVEKAQNVVILLLDESEVEIDTLFSGKFKKGLNKINPDLSYFDSGFYFYTFVGIDSMYTKKILLIK